MLMLTEKCSRHILTAIVVLFFNKTNSEELQVLTATRFSLNTLPRQTLKASLLKCVLESIAGVFSLGKIYIFFKKCRTETRQGETDTTMDKEILISRV